MLDLLCSPKAKGTEDEHDHDDQPNKVDDAVHGSCSAPHPAQWIFRIKLGPRNNGFGCSPFQSDAGEASAKTVDDLFVEPLKDI